MMHPRFAVDGRRPFIKRIYLVKSMPFKTFPENPVFIPVVEYFSLKNAVWDSRRVFRKFFRHGASSTFKRKQVQSLRL